MFENSLSISTILTSSLESPFSMQDVNTTPSTKKAWILLIEGIKI